MLLIHPYSINATHRGKERDSVIARCLELVKIYGISPNLLLNTIKENKVTKIIVLPIEEAKRILNSLCSVFNTENHNKDHREGIAQNSLGINMIPKNVDNQFSGK